MSHSAADIEKLAPTRQTPSSGHQRQLANIPYSMNVADALRFAGDVEARQAFINECPPAASGSGFG
ncbi:MAG: hypothetical protein P8Z80_19715 [Pseudolabrys sp.]